MHWIALYYLKIEFVVKKHSSKKTPRWHYWRNLQTYNSTQTFPQNIEKEGILPNIVVVVVRWLAFIIIIIRWLAFFTLIAKPVKYCTRKENYRLVSLLNIDAKTQTNPYLNKRRRHRDQLDTNSRIQLTSHHPKLGRKCSPWMDKQNDTSIQWNTQQGQRVNHWYIQQCD